MLISIDGIDGCGKSTQVKRLAAVIGAEHITEISPSRWGKQLRAMENPGLAEQLALFTADRAHLAPRLEEVAGHESKHIVSDRSYLSSIAYQSFDSGLTPSFLERMMRVLVPEYDLMVFLDVSVEVGLGRVESRGVKRTWCETTGRLTWARRVFESWEGERSNIVRVDGNRDIESVHADVRAAADAAAKASLGRIPW